MPPQQQFKGEKKENKLMILAAVVVGGALAFFFSPFVALCALCCFQTRKSRGGVLLGGSLSSFLWAVGAFVGYGIVDQLAIREEKREIGVTEPGNYYFDGEKSIRCTETNFAGNSVFGENEELCFYNTPGFRDALLSARTGLLVAGIALGVIGLVYLGAGVSMMKGGKKGGKRDIATSEDGTAN